VTPELPQAKAGIGIAPKPTNALPKPKWFDVVRAEWKADVTDIGAAAAGAERQSEAAALRAQITNRETTIFWFLSKIIDNLAPIANYAVW
jgi:hypothetical protein